mgnify:FL=1
MQSIQLSQIQELKGVRGCVIIPDNGNRGRAESPKTPSPGHRPGYSKSQQGAL